MDDWVIRAGAAPPGPAEPNGLARRVIRFDRRCIRLTHHADVFRPDRPAFVILRRVAREVFAVYAPRALLLFAATLFVGLTGHLLLRGVLPLIPVALHIVIACHCPIGLSRHRDSRDRAIAHLPHRERPSADVAIPDLLRLGEPLGDLSISALPAFGEALGAKEHRLALAPRRVAGQSDRRFLRSRLFRHQHTAIGHAAFEDIGIHSRRPRCLPGRRLVPGVMLPGCVLARPVVLIPPILKIDVADALTHLETNGSGVHCKSPVGNTFACGFCHEYVCLAGVPSSAGRVADSRFAALFVQPPIANATIVAGRTVQCDLIL